jgi:hypothetical protein
MRAMSLEGISSSGPAQRALARILRTAYGDEARAVACVQRALDACGEPTLPNDADALLELVKVYLAPSMQVEVGRHLVNAMLDDLEAEIEHLKTGQDPYSSSRIAVSTRMPPPGSPAESADAPSAVHAVREPSLTDLVAIDSLPRELGLDRPSDPFGDHLRSEWDEPDPSSAEQQTGVQRRSSLRLSIVLVDGDRFGRASLARALVQGLCDVTVVEIEDAVSVVESDEPIDIVITDIDGIDVEPMLHALRRVRPRVPVLVWTKSARAVADHVARTCNLARFDHISKVARSAEILLKAHALVES